METIDNNINNGYPSLFWQNFTNGINNISINNNGLSIYPNPASNYVNIKLENTSHSNLTLNIYNIIGLLVKSETIANDQQKINISDLNNGTYLLEIKSNFGTKTQKLIIRK